MGDEIIFKGPDKGKENQEGQIVREAKIVYRRFILKLFILVEATNIDYNKGMVR